MTENVSNAKFAILARTQNPQLLSFCSFCHPKRIFILRSSFFFSPNYYKASLWKHG